MKASRRMKRMARNHGKKVPGMSLTSLMDVFTILVFFLLVNSSNSEVLEAPKHIELPASVVEAKPRETAVVTISDTEILVSGEPVTTYQEVLEAKELSLPIAKRLKEITQNVIGVSTRTVAESREVTILSHKTIPFKVMQKVMASASLAGYEKISLAVIQKANQDD